MNPSIYIGCLPTRTKLTKQKISQSEVIFLTKSLQLLSTSKDPTPYTYACGEVSSSPCVLLKIKRAFWSTPFSFHHNFINHQVNQKQISSLIKKNFVIFFNLFVTLNWHCNWFHSLCFFVKGLPQWDECVWLRPKIKIKNVAKGSK